MGRSERNEQGITAEWLEHGKQDPAAEWHAAKRYAAEWHDHGAE